jgi:hypothetical protein
MAVGIEGLLLWMGIVVVVVLLLSLPTDATAAAFEEARGDGHKEGTGSSHSRDS